MSKRKFLTNATVLSLVMFLIPNTAQAADETVVQPSSTYKTFTVPVGLPLTANDLKKISDLNLTFKYAGVECQFKATDGCTVIKSSNAIIPVGLVIKAIATRSQSGSVSTAAYKMKCGWCAVAGDILAITLFVVAAPASTPTAIVVATYGIGVGIILGHA
jgi:hypothetical protein